MNPPDPCDPPTNFVVDNITLTSANLHWNTVTNATNYTVKYKAVNSGGGWTTVTANTSSYMLINLAPGTTYNLRLTANCGNNSSNMVTLDFTTLLSGSQPQLWKQSATGNLLPTKDTANVGIGTTEPIARLQVDATASKGSVLFNGKNGKTPTEGPGVRFMWIPELAALRTGEALSTEWDQANIGKNTHAIGTGVSASKDYAMAFGKDLTVEGMNAIGIGYSINVKQNDIVTIGFKNQYATFTDILTTLVVGGTTPAVTIGVADPTMKLCELSIGKLKRCTDCDKLPAISHTNFSGNVYIKDDYQDANGKAVMGCGGFLTVKNAVHTGNLIAYHDAHVRTTLFLGYPSNLTDSGLLNSSDAFKFGRQANAYALDLSANATPIMTFDGGKGNVGIHNTQPNAWLHVGANYLVVSENGSVGIGLTNPSADYKLEVCGKIHATEVNVKTQWCDYVFEDSYRLRPLSEVEAYIKAHKHLPEIPAGKTIETEGLDLGQTSALFMKKIEELTLYIIELEKKVQQLSK